MFLNSSTEAGSRSTDETIRYIYGLVSTANQYNRLYEASDIGISAVAFGGRKGYGAGIVPLTVSGKMSYFFCRRFDKLQFAEECCPYTVYDLYNASRTDIPPPMMCQMLIQNNVPGYTLTAPIQLGKTPHYDFRLFPWYRYAKDDSYHWELGATNLGRVIFTVARKIVDEFGEFYGVASVGYVLESGFHEFVRGLELKHGNMYMVSQIDGSVLSTTDDEFKLTRLDPQTGLPTTTKIYESDDSFVETMYEYIRTKYSSDSKVLASIEQIKGEKFEHENEKYLLEAKTITNIVGGMKILMIHATKESVLFDSIQKGNITSILICVGIIIFFAVLTIVVVCIVLYPLVLLGNQMKKVEKMELDRIHIWCFSPFSEIRHVQQRFRYSVKKLIEFRAFLPDYLLRDTEKDELEELFDSNGTSSISSGSLEKPFDDNIDESDDLQTEEAINTVIEVTEQPGAEEDRRSTGGSSGGSNSSNNSSNGSTNSFVSNQSMATLAAPSEKNKFGLGITRKYVLCMFIQLTNWREIFHSNPTNFCEKFSDFFTFIIDVTKKFGKIHTFQADNIVLYYARSSIVQVVKHVRKIKSTVISRRYSFEVVIGLSLDMTLVGVIGQKRLKMGCLFDGAVEKSKFMIRNHCSTFRKQFEEGVNDHCTILFDGTFESQIRKLGNNGTVKSFTYIPHNIYVEFYHPWEKCVSSDQNTEGTYKDVIDVFIVYDDHCNNNKNNLDGGIRDNKEWMYEVDRIEKEKTRNAFLKGYLYLKLDSVRKAKRCLEQCRNAKFYKESSFDSCEEDLRTLDDDEEEEGEVVYYNTRIESSSTTDRKKKKKCEKSMFITPQKLLIVGMIEEDENYDLFGHCDLNAKEFSEYWSKLSDRSVLFSIEDKNMPTEKKELEKNSEEGNDKGLLDLLDECDEDNSMIVE